MSYITLSRFDSLLLIAPVDWSTHTLAATEILTNPSDDGSTLIV